MAGWNNCWGYLVRCFKQYKYTGKVMVAVNHEYVDMSHLLNKNDEVAFFPPVTGG